MPDSRPAASTQAVERLLVGAPEAQDVEELLADLGVVPVQVGLGGVEDVQVPLAGRAVGLGDLVQPCPPNTDGQLFGGSSPCSPRPSRKTYRSRSGLPCPARPRSGLEPRVLTARVVGHEVDEHLEPEVVKTCAIIASASARVPKRGSMSR